MLTQAGNPTSMAHAAPVNVSTPRRGVVSGPAAGTATAERTAAPPLRRRSSRQAVAGPRSRAARAPRDGAAGCPLAGTATAEMTAASPLRDAPSCVAMAGSIAGEARPPLGGTASRPLAGEPTAAITATSPVRRAPDRQAMAGDVADTPRGGPSAGNATAHAAAAAPLQRASAGAATVRPSPALGRWRRHGEPGDHCSPPAAIARDDPRFARLPYGDGTVHRFGCEAPTAESVTLAVGLLRSAGWRVHRVGAAMAAQHPSGRRWIVGWSVGDRRPPRLDRLPALTTGSAA